MTKTALIVAMDQGRGIGKNNDLMWNLPNDMKFFKETTRNHIVVMGRKNYESIPEKYRPLPERLNCVITHNTEFKAPGCMVFQSLMDCVKHFSDDARKLFIIGGGEIYKLAFQSLSLDELYITEVAHRFNADTFLVEFDETDWKKDLICDQEPDARHAYGFKIYHYTK